MKPVNDVIIGLMPLLANVVVVGSYASMDILAKLAMGDGMEPLILAAYRQIFSALAIAPIAFFLERKTRPKITLSILFQIFLCSVTGSTAFLVCFYIGLKNTTVTIACALSNIVPVATFVLAALCRQESVGIKKASGQAKVWGTLVCVGGAMLLSFYHGHIIGIGESGIQLGYADTSKNYGSSSRSTTSRSNFFLGPFLVMVSALSWALWLIIQGQTSKKFPAPYTCTALMCLMASIECTLIGIFSDHRPSAWSLRSPIRLTAALYSGVVCNAVAVCLVSWCIQKKGPLYVSVFSPLTLVIAAILSWAFLHEKLHVGTVIGSVLIIGGLYSVLWGKDRETKEAKSLPEDMDAAAAAATKPGNKDNYNVDDDDNDDDDLELQPQGTIKL